MSGSGTSSEPVFPLSALDYELPPDRIAQYPVEPRDHARLLVVERSTGRFADQHVYDLPWWLRSGDLLVLNDTKVIPARLLGRREATRGKWEGLFLKQLPDGRWELMAQTRGSPKPGEWVALDQGGVRLHLTEKTAEGHWLARPDPLEPAEVLLERCGHTPLPPYIRKGRAGPADRQRYQTVYARQAGSVAAPTAGMHFTPQLLDRLEAAGVRRTFVTLHVGVGTFQPIQSDDVTRHVMHCEWCEITQSAVDAIQRCRQEGGRIVAVGTTSVRVLETAARLDPLRPWRGETDLYIYPPFEFRLVDALMTNFHLPRSSLLALVAAFMGLEQMHAAYRHAIAAGYRFYSYGDAMLIL
ncbi:MAG: tRNA preQ1(34) S-adenosylmethionine ribosyltransferase-isomerase QueA [Gemmatales bacterium]|nr:tRNA preQ1(34) S-adenosylmethionine ribosyltransferase-isomerase QueA [Gemmatales bacterium]MDW8385795.1 tRNA preQ1(34) S-adenosylmethionine ribosyltransferase-isomerase QueA [Gemmatales bacterium]